MSQPTERNKIVSEVMRVIGENFGDGCFGLFDTRNTVGAPMENIYEKDGVSVDICRRYSYFEVFGLTDDELLLVRMYYQGIKSLTRGGRFGEV